MAADGVASAHLSTVNRPATVANGPLVAPQNEQRPVWSVTGSPIR
jgi:hypothetical protein